MARYSYDYVKRYYGVDPVVGAEVIHEVTGKRGKIAAPGSHGHYVRVLFDGIKHALPCHPTELNYSPSVAG